jgi:hypothetical protein
MALTGIICGGIGIVLTIAAIALNAFVTLGDFAN